MGNAGDRAAATCSCGQNYSDCGWPDCGADHIADERLVQGRAGPSDDVLGAGDQEPGGGFRVADTTPPFHPDEDVWFSIGTDVGKPSISVEIQKEQVSALLLQGCVAVFGGEIRGMLRRLEAGFGATGVRLRLVAEAIRDDRPVNGG